MADPAHALQSTMLRLFIAARLTPELVRALAGSQNKLKQRLANAPLSWTRPEGIHITLKFLGDTESGRVDAIMAALSRAVVGHGPLTLTVGGFGCFPNPRNANVLWVGVEDADGRLAKLAAAVDKATAPLGWEPERRPFTAHLTLARVQRNAHPDQRRSLGDVLPGITLPALGSLTIHDLHLIRSELTPQGSIYTELGSVSLRR